MAGFFAISSFGLALIFSSSLAQAQNNQLPTKKVKSVTVETPISETQGTALAPDAPFIFKTENFTSDEKPAFQFKAPPPGTLLESPSEKTNAEKMQDLGDTPFRAYLGYPKNRFLVSALPVSISSTWTYQDQDFNYKSSPIGLGLGYQFVTSPMNTVSIDYSRFTAKVNSATVSPFDIQESKVDFDPTLRQRESLPNPKHECLSSNLPQIDSRI